MAIGNRKERKRQRKDSQGALDKAQLETVWTRVPSIILFSTARALATQSYDAEVMAKGLSGSSCSCSIGRKAGSPSCEQSSETAVSLHASTPIR